MGRYPDSNCFSWVSALKLSHQTLDDLGYADSISREEVGGSRPVKSKSGSRVCRGSVSVQKLPKVIVAKKEDMLKQVESCIQICNNNIVIFEGWCDSQGTLHEIRTKLQMRQGAVKNFYVNHFVLQCLSNKNGAVLD
ncbi:hypothetical protein IFM89_021427 [Coptis chinensis]|uniref:Uncharacterized protein n=1 Tax=Coptis chinensis TaxID=261450 RepID=A0A835I494_9MAGN|nr:hypothetical protein IFM89_021427 [Coptis chinensis]